MPLGRAMPPRRGSAGALSACRRAFCTEQASRTSDRPAMGRAAYSTRARVLPVTAREETEQSEHEDDDEDDPEDAHTDPPFVCMEALFPNRAGRNASRRVRTRKSRPEAALLPRGLGRFVQTP